MQTIKLIEGVGVCYTEKGLPVYTHQIAVKIPLKRVLEIIAELAEKGKRAIIENDESVELWIHGTEENKLDKS